MTRPRILLIGFTLLVLAYLAFGLPNLARSTRSTIARNENDSIGSRPTPSELKTSQPSSPIVIPFRLTKDNNLVVRAKLNESESLDLMFHTAFEGLALTEEAVKSMPNLRWSESVIVQSWGGSSETKVSVGNQLQIESLRWANMSLIVDQLSGTDTVGKFGPDLFQEKVLEIDFDLLQLVIHDSIPDKARTSQSNFEKMAYTVERGSMYLAIELLIGDQRIQHPLMIHSGFGGTMLLDDEFVRRHDLISIFPPIRERELKDSFGNILKTRTLELPQINVGRLSFSKIPIEVFDGDLGKQKVSVLGGKLLKRFNCIIDPKRHEIYLRPSHHYLESLEG